MTDRTKMPKKAATSGGVLIALGVIVTIVSDSQSVTSLIPAFIGAVFLILGLLARAKPDLNHHLMHALAAIALLAVLGSLGSLISRSSTGWALFAQLATTVIAGFLLQQSVMAFKNRSKLTTEES
ncbi:MAG: hypothetical protein NZ605_11585 [Acidimicrobiales bacterium]|nr:hypothetical protein [Acidimicrobiales bacterium]